MANLTLSVDDEVLREAGALYRSLGMSMTTAVNIFFRESLQAGGIPFAVTALARGVPVAPAAMLEPRTSAAGAAVLPADWDDAEDDVYDSLYA